MMHGPTHICCWAPIDTGVGPSSPWHLAVHVCRAAPATWSTPTLCPHRDQPLIILDLWSHPLLHAKWQAYLTDLATDLAIADAPLQIVSLGDRTPAEASKSLVYTRFGRAGGRAGEPQSRGCFPRRRWLCALLRAPRSCSTSPLTRRPAVGLSSRTSVGLSPSSA